MIDAQTETEAPAKQEPNHSLPQPPPCDASDWLFARSQPGRTAFELPPLEVERKTPTFLPRKTPASLPELTEDDLIQALVSKEREGDTEFRRRLSIVDETGALPAYSDAHPDLPESLFQGTLEVLFHLERALCEISGMDKCSLNSSSRNDAEAAAFAMIRAFHTRHGSHRKYVLVPSSCVEPMKASCLAANFLILPVEDRAQGRLRLESVTELLEQHGREIAALWVQNPSGYGIFERDLPQIAGALHDIGAQVFLDGSHFKALVGIASPREMGADLVRWDLGRSFGTESGPGLCPIAALPHLADFLPGPLLTRHESLLRWDTPSQSVGQLSPRGAGLYHGVTTLCALYGLGSEGLKRATRNAVLNLGYLQKKLSNRSGISITGSNFHGFVIRCKNSTGGLEREWVIEPGEWASLQSLDVFCDAVLAETRGSGLGGQA